MFDNYSTDPRIKKGCMPAKDDWVQYLADFKSMKPEVKKDIRRKYSKSSTELHYQIYSRRDFDQVTSYLLKEDSNKVRSLLLTPDSCGNSPLLLIAQHFESKLVELLLDLLLNVLEEAKLVHANDQKQNFVHSLLVNKDMKLSDKIAVLQRVQKQKSDIYASMLASHDVYDNIPLTYGFDLLRRHKSDPLSNRIELARLLTPAQNLAEYVIIKTDPTKLKLVLKGAVVDNQEPEFKDHLEQLNLVIRFNDNPLKALVLSKDVEVIKFLVSQKFFLLEGVSLTEIGKQESKSNILLQRVRFLFESFGDKKADLEIEELLFQHYAKELEQLFVLTNVDDDFGSKAFDMQARLIRNILEKSLDAGFSIEEAFKRPVAEMFIRNGIAAKSTENRYSYLQAVMEKFQISTLQRDRKLKLKLLEVAIPYFDPQGFQLLAAGELSKLFDWKTAKKTVVEIFEVLWDRISKDSADVATKLIINWLKEGRLDQNYRNLAKFLMILTSLGDDLLSKILEARWIYQYLLRCAILSKAYDTSLEIIKKYGSRFKEFDTRSPKQFLVGLFGEEPKPPKKQNAENEDYEYEGEYDEYDEYQEDTGEVNKRALSVLAKPKSRAVLEALIESGFTLSYTEEELLEFDTERTLLPWILQKKGYSSINISALKEKTTSLSFPASYEELLWLVKTLEINFLDDANPFKSVNRLGEKDLIHLLNNVILGGKQHDGKAIENVLTFEFKEGTIPYIALIHSHHTLFVECMTLLEKVYSVYSNEYKEALAKIFVHKPEEEYEEEITTYDRERNIQTAIILGAPSLLKLCAHLGTENLQKGLRSLSPMMDSFAFSYYVLQKLLLAHVEDVENEAILLEVIQILSKNSKMLFVSQAKYNTIDMLVFNLFKTLQFKCDADSQGKDEYDDSYKPENSESAVFKFFDEFKEIPDFLDLLVHSLGYGLDTQGQSRFKLCVRGDPVYTARHLLSLRKILMETAQKVSKNLPPGSSCKYFKSFQMRTGAELPSDMDAISFYIFIIDWVMNLMLLEELDQGNPDSFTLSLVQAFSTAKLMSNSGKHIDLYYLVKASNLWSGAYFLEACHDNYPQIKEALCP